MHHRTVTVHDIARCASIVPSEPLYQTPNVVTYWRFADIQFAPSGGRL